MKIVVVFSKVLISSVILLNLFHFQTQCMMEECIDPLEINASSPLIVDIDQLAKAKQKKELYKYLYEFLKKNDLASSNKILEHLKRLDTNLGGGDKYLTKAIIEQNASIVAFWVENLLISYNHLYLALKTSPDMTNIILNRFKIETKNSTKKREKLYNICKIIKKKGGLPENIVTYWTLFSILRKLVKITPKDQFPGYEALKKFTKENNIIDLDEEIHNNKYSYERL